MNTTASTFPCATIAAPDSTAPFTKEVVVLTRQEHIELKAQVNRYKALHERALNREVELKKQLEQEKAKVRDLTQRLYGKKSEQSQKNDDKREEDCPQVSRAKGQQKGSQGHGRTHRPDLPVVTELRDLAEQDKCCVNCGLPHRELNSTDDSQIVEVVVKAHIRQIKLKKYVKQCDCEGVKNIITASPAPRVFNRNDIGVSVWVEILLDKYLNAQATHRLLNNFASLGYPLSPGTVTGGLQRFAPLLKPIIEALRIKQLTERLFHADETGWKVFEKIAGKEGYRWYLWLIQSPSVAYYLMAPGRDAGVPTKHFGGLEKGHFKIFLVCDRYCAYGKLVKNIPFIVLAFCWAHVRRDFLDAARSWPALKDWMLRWVDDIAELYHINNRRLPHWDENKPLHKQSNEFKQHHTALRNKLVAMRVRRNACLQQRELEDIQRKVLTSLHNHWLGLVLFLRYPQIKMDNNTAESALRNPVTARKRFYGSGSVWSAELAAFMFSIFQTLSLWRINQRHWLFLYLNACAENGGNAPKDLSVFLPWEMTADRLQTLTQPPPIVEINNSS